MCEIYRRNFIVADEMNAERAAGSGRADRQALTMERGCTAATPRRPCGKDGIGDAGRSARSDISCDQVAEAMKGHAVYASVSFTFAAIPI